MLNQIVLIGWLVQDPEIKIIDSGKKVSEITLAVRRGFKNIEGNYDTDFYPCYLWEGLAETVIAIRQRAQLAMIGRVKLEDMILLKRYLNRK